MSNVQLKINTSEWERFIDKIRVNLDAHKLLIAAWMTFGFKDVIEHFEKEEGESGAWSARAFDTNRRYDKISRGEWKPPNGMRRGSFRSSNKLLQLTGKLRQSMLGGGEITKKGSHAIMIQSNVDYSATHEYGDPSRNIPRRSFMWLSGDAQEKMSNFFLETLLHGA